MTAQFLSTSLTFYRQAAEACSEVFQHCQDQGWHRVVLCGVSDLTEIAQTRSSTFPIAVVGLYDPNFRRNEHLALPVWRGWADVPEVDGYMLTDLADPLRTYKMLLRHVGEPERVLVPRVLGLDAAINHDR